MQSFVTLYRQNFNKHAGKEKKKKKGSAVDCHVNKTAFIFSEFF